MYRVIISLVALGLAGCGERELTWGDAGRAVLGVSLVATCAALTSGKAESNCANFIW
jgi:hypothetical protein